MLCRRLIAECWASVRDDVCGRRGIKGNHSAMVAGLDQVVSAAAAPELIALAVELTGGRVLFGWQAEKSPEAKTLLSSLGIDRKAVEKAAVAELKAKKGGKG